MKNFNFYPSTPDWKSAFEEVLESKSTTTLNGHYIRDEQRDFEEASRTSLSDPSYLHQERIKLYLEMQSEIALKQSRREYLQWSTKAYQQSIFFDFSRGGELPEMWMNILIMTGTMVMT